MSDYRFWLQASDAERDSPHTEHFSYIEQGFQDRESSEQSIRDDRYSDQGTMNGSKRYRQLYHRQ